MAVATAVAHLTACQLTRPGQSSPLFIRTIITQHLLHTSNARDVLHAVWGGRGLLEAELNLTNQASVSVCVFVYSGIKVGIYVNREFFM